MFDLGEEVYLGNENLFEFGCILSSLIFIDGVAILLFKKVTNCIILQQLT